VTQGTLVGTSILLAVPSLLIFLSVALSPRISQILNVVFGIIYTLMMAMLAFQADWYFYKFFALVEALLTALVVWYAWTWPKATSNQP
jgi:nicotinamide riboside transporter PnuC